MAAPTWSKEALSARTKICSTFKDSLVSVSEGIALQEKAERVLVKHVADSERILECHGKNRSRSFWTHELESSLGGILIGGALSIHSAIVEVLKIFAPAADNLKWIVPIGIGGAVLVFLAGIFLVGHAWLRCKGYLPRLVDTPASPTVEQDVLNGLATIPEVESA